MASFQTKEGNRQVQKRTVGIFDQSKKSITLTLWDKMAEDISFKTLDIVAFKNVRVTDYSGKTLTASFTTRIIPNPDIPETKVLKDWYAQWDSHEPIQSITRDDFKLPPRKCLSAIRKENQDVNAKAEYIMAKGTIIDIRRSTDKPPWYMSCPEPKCKQKVTQSHKNDSWYCEKCNKSVSPMRKFVLSVLIVDHCEAVWSTMFDETAQKMLRTTADKMADVLQHDKEIFDSIFQRAFFQTYIFKLGIAYRINEKTGEPALQLCATNAEPVKYVDESKYMLTQISELMKQ